MTQKTLTSYTPEDLTTLFAEMGEKRFRAEQTFSWLHKGKRPAEMTNLPISLREKLSEIPFGGVRIEKKRVSEIDGTIKYLFSLEDGNIIEGVLMKYSYGNTLCVSTQVGCNMGCSFCASTLEGCVRSLSAGEILSEVLTVENDVDSLAEIKGRNVTNVVMMGSGEPLDNYEGSVGFLKLVSDSRGINISPRNISLSTCGFPDKIKRLIEDAPHVTLSISLHAPTNELRSRIMPINKVYPIETLLNAAKSYADITGRRVIFEYALIADLNDTELCARLLSKRLAGINCHVNLIPLNSVEERNLVGTSRERAYEFAKMLESLRVSATVRREMGSDINGACGQLRRGYIDNRIKK